MLALALLLAAVGIIALALGVALLMGSLPEPERPRRAEIVRTAPPRPPVGALLPPGEDGHLQAALAFQRAADMYVDECLARVEAGSDVR